jgi:carboxypeptidase C (cathepsin A)
MRRHIILCFLLLGCSYALQAYKGGFSKDSLSVTRHTLQTPAGVMPYTATAGYMPMKDEKDSIKARLFFTAYTKDGVSDPAARPILFAFNGGPGSSSVWLHMGLIGPQRVIMHEEGEALAPPYRYTDNAYSWLPEADIVFIDPMYTGYTRPEGNTPGRDYVGYNNDIRFVGDFIRLYLTRYKRWTSPKLLAGESYGTTRAAGLASHLQETHGIYINGIVLISAILNFGTVRTDRGNDLPYVLTLPTFAATAWYHKKAGTGHARLEDFVREAEAFASGPYAAALMKGDRISDAERSSIIGRLQGFTGLSAAYLDRANMRVTVGRFNKELLRDEGRTVGRFDGRIKGTDYDNVGDSYEWDPSYDLTVRGPYTAAFNDYVRRALRYESDLPYEILTGRVQPWPLGENKYLNVSDALRSAMVKNPALKVWVCNGYYDMATPYYATDYVVHHMGLPKELRGHVRMTYYKSGHMQYTRKADLIQLREDYKDFLQDAIKPQ